MGGNFKLKFVQAAQTKLFRQLTVFLTVWDGNACFIGKQEKAHGSTLAQLQTVGLDVHKPKLITFKEF